MLVERKIADRGTMIFGCGKGDGFKRGSFEKQMVQGYVGRGVRFECCEGMREKRYGVWESSVVSCS